MTCSLALRIPVLRLLRCNEFPYPSNPCVLLPKLRYISLNQKQFQEISSTDGNNAGSSFSAEPEDASGSSDNSRGGGSTSNETLKKLRRYGVAGILSYGLLNTAYYLTTFLVVWLYVTPSPGKMGYLAAAQRFLKVMAMVWAGSQVTKLLRAGGALALAPFVDRGLSWFTVKFHFESQGKAFAAIVGACFGLALVLFLAVTLLWA